MQPLPPSFLPPLNGATPGAAAKNGRASRLALAQWLVSSPLSKANIQEFAIDGSWSEPRVTRIELPPSGKNVDAGHKP